MKKRFFPILFVFLMVFSSTAYAASTRAAAVVPRISFNGTTASCTVFIAADRPTDDIEAVIKEVSVSKLGKNLLLEILPLVAQQRCRGEKLIN